MTPSGNRFAALRAEPRKFPFGSGTSSHMHSAPSENDFSRPFSQNPDGGRESFEKNRKESCGGKSNLTGTLRVHTTPFAGECIAVNEPSLAIVLENLLRIPQGNVGTASAHVLPVRKREECFRKVERCRGHHEGKILFVGGGVLASARASAEGRRNDFALGGGATVPDRYRPYRARACAHGEVFSRAFPDACHLRDFVSYVAGLWNSHTATIFSKRSSFGGRRRCCGTCSRVLTGRLGRRNCVEENLDTAERKRRSSASVRRVKLRQD